MLVIGASGGAGATTLALGLALALARASRRPTLLELDLLKGGLDVALGVKADRGLADLLPVADELGAEHLAPVAYPHASGMSVVFASGAPGDARRWSDAAGRLVAVASAAGGPVVVDGGAGLCSASAAVAGLGAEILVLTPPSVIGARRARVLLDALGAAGGRLVVGPPLGREDLGARATGLAVGAPVLAALPRSPREARDLGTGRWPRGRRAPLATAIARLAEALG
jgi:Flp pilus assembly CpaE family ATPase